MRIHLPRGTNTKPANEPAWWAGKPVRFLAGGVSVALAFGSVLLPMIPVWVTMIGVAAGLLITVPFALEGVREFWTADNRSR